MKKKILWKKICCEYLPCVVCFLIPKVCPSYCLDTFCFVCYFMLLNNLIGTERYFILNEACIKSGKKTAVNGRQTNNLT